MLILLLSLLPLSSSSPPPATVNVSRCPMDLSYVQKVPWPVSDYQTCNPEIPASNSNNLTRCCQTLLSLFGIALAQRLKQTSLFRLPDYGTSVACLADFQSGLHVLSLPSHLTSVCFDPRQFVITPDVCAAIESTRDWVAKLRTNTSLDSDCRPDLTDLTACDACVAAGFQVQGNLIAIDGRQEDEQWFLHGRQQAQ